MNVRNWPLGVCSWSLQQDLSGVTASMQSLGLRHVHLAVGPVLDADGEAYLARAAEAPWTITATMVDFPQEDYSTLHSIRVTGGIVPDDCWDDNHTRFARAADVTRQLKVRYLTMHAGFIDLSERPYAQKIEDRIRNLADVAGESGLMLLLETGQETAQEMRHLFERLDHAALGINFDPANMILYGQGDPIEAVGTLAPWLRHVHVKDALPANRPGQWGTEVPWGEGRVEPHTFLAALQKANFTGALAIEREGGDDRLGDIRTAVERLADHADTRSRPTGG